MDIIVNKWHGSKKTYFLTNGNNEEKSDISVGPSGSL